MSFLLDIVVNPCETLDILKIAYFIRNILDLAFIIIPIILVVILSFDLVKNVVSGDEGAQRKNFNIFIKRIIFTAVVFLVPTFVRFTMDFVGDGLGVNMSGYLKCLNVTESDILDLVSVEKAKCTSQGWEWNDKMEICNSKIEASETAKKLVEELKEINSSSSKYSSRFAGGSSSFVVGDYSIAESALMMALPSRDAARAPSYGSELYGFVYDSVLPEVNEADYRLGKKQEHPNGSSRYRSCAEAAATSIRWSGSDDSYPKGGPAEQLNYVSNSSKWKKVEWNGDVSKLQPGDIFVDRTHTLIYIGKELLHKYFPKAPDSYNIAQASYQPQYTVNAEALCVTEIDLSNQAIKSRWWGNVFRNVQKEANSKYASIKIPSNIKVNSPS